MTTRRNYSSLCKDPHCFDAVSVNGIDYVIPARPGSMFWAVLRVLYERCNQAVFPEQLAVAVQALMLDRNPRAWQTHCERPNRKPWKERLMMTAMMLTRSSGNDPDGLRLAERGHLLRLEHDAEGRAYFILRTNVDAPLDL
ncbi:MAG: hypothetical protein ACM359_01610 [Bacillota bacterium]